MKNMKAKLLKIAFLGIFFLGIETASAGTTYYNYYYNHYTTRTHHHFGNMNFRVYHWVNTFDEHYEYYDTVKKYYTGGVLMKTTTITSGPIFVGETVKDNTRDETDSSVPIEW
jgi:hypothetical protein